MRQGDKKKTLLLGNQGEEKRVYRGIERKEIYSRPEKELGD